ncbi:hypothetical protein BOTBODRAFT_35762 [Botryobasidium botryosum FD-172 SS1]|uniref:Uncharacterized protein n=1 Tax=Botryobasidium botryosum (strain FD-172 SS1) TaxID=930990 RepID=A0A067M5F4_BOTB1|nr:hypothetical protein BOTBODRAFT_35762 [Botryobasidium botryosum FD-172 SS1]
MSPTLMMPVTPTNHRFYRTPASSSPLRPVGSSPAAPSSPLNPHYHTYQPPSSSRRSSYKSRISKEDFFRTPPSGGGLRSRHGAQSNQEGPQLLWRERFLAKCVKRMSMDRQKQREARRMGTSAAYPGSSDIGSSEADMDMDMEEDENEVDDELYRRVINSENLRKKRMHEYSYQHDVGSSIDPDMDDVAALEEEFVRSNPAGNEYDPLEDEAEMAAEYEAYLASQTMDADMVYDTPHAACGSLFLETVLSSACPQCATPSLQPMSQSDMAAPGMVCGHCQLTVPLGQARESWNKYHPYPDPAHVPLATNSPLVWDGLFMMCAMESCSWAHSF